MRSLMNSLPVPGGQKFPSGHFVGLIAPTTFDPVPVWGQIYPAGQVMHLSAPRRAYVPAGHAVLALDPSRRYKFVSFVSKVSNRNLPCNI